MATRDEVFEVLRQVEDPELGMDIVDLGLVYEVEMEDSTAKVTYSLTSMGCPAGPLIAQDIDSAVRQVEGIEGVELELTFDPPWTPDRMADAAKLILGLGPAEVPPRTRWRRRGRRARCSVPAASGHRVGGGRGTPGDKRSIASPAAAGGSVRAGRAGGRGCRTQDRARAWRAARRAVSPGSGA